MAAGPPPGLGMSAPPAATLPSNPFGANGSPSTSAKSPAALAKQKASFLPSGTYDRPDDCPRFYSRATLLAYSFSPLSTKPQAMGALREWYGEWEPFHHKSANNYRESSRRAHAEEANAHHSHQDGADDGANNGSGIIGGALGGFGPRREGAGARFGGRRNEDRERGERGEGLRIGEVPSRRGAPAGKNPFGQISASGTFKPAGVPRPGQQAQRDGSQLEGIGENRRYGLSERSTSFGKDRMRDALPEDRRGQRFGETRETAARERRSRGDRDAEEFREDGDLVESPRMRRAGGADQASDWRKAGDRDRGSNFTASERRAGDRKGAARGAGPAWTGDADDNPAWMDDETDALPIDHRAPFGQFGTRRKNPDNADGATDMDGAVDSIQAFKAQMKERERRERQARGEPEPSTEHNSDFSIAPPPGLGRDSSREYPFGGSADKSTQESEMEAIRSEMIAAANQRSTSGGSIYDSISNSHDGQSQGVGGPPGLPGRSSRFARFFDGKGGAPRDPQAAALAAQQKMLEAMGGRSSAPADADKDKDTLIQSPSATSGNASAASPSINISDLFSKASIKGDGAKDKSGKPVSEADQQSMQKLMAMLQGGGAGNGGEGGSHDGRDSAMPSSAPRSDSANRLKGLLGTDAPRASSTDRGHRNDSADHLAHHATESATTEARSSTPQSQHQRSSSQQQQQQQQHHQAPQPQQSQAQQQQQQYPQYQQARSSSPGMAGSPYSDPRQQMGGMGSPGLGPGGYGGYGGNVPGRPPPGMDPRLMGRPPVGAPGFQQMPPHIAAALGLGRGGPVPPPGMGGPGPNGSGPFPGFAPFPGGRPPMPPGMPPQMYQQLMSMPPHIQQQVLSGQGLPPGAGPPPRSPYDLSDRNVHSPPPHNNAGGGTASPSFPYYAQSPPLPHQHRQQPQQQQQGQGQGQGHAMSPSTSPPPPSVVGSHAMNGANLMALLSAGRNTPSNPSS